MDKNRPQGAFEAELPAELQSAFAARRLVAEASVAWGLNDAVSHDAALAVSELVTNSVIHAGTPVQVRIARLGNGMRVEVADENDHLPVVEAACPEDLLANRTMTGRGLALVAATADRWGCDRRPVGKVTWAEVGTGRRRVEPAPAPAFPPTPPAPRIPADALARGVVQGATVAGGGRTVHLVGVPVELLLESTRQLTDLQREVRMMAMARHAPPGLEQVVQAGKPWVTDIDLWTDADRRMAETAAASGAQTIDFDVYVPDDIASRIEGITAWLRRAAASIRRRQLLTLPATAEVTAYRRWISEEILRQLSGRAPEPCPVRIKASAS